MQKVNEDSDEEDSSVDSVRLLQAEIDRLKSKSKNHCESVIFREKVRDFSSLPFLNFLNNFYFIPTPDYNYMSML